MDTKQNIKLAAIVLVVALVLGGGVFGIAAYRNRQPAAPTPTPTPSPAVSVTEAPTPTYVAPDDETPAPTARPTSRPVTPTATRTPGPTPTRTPTPSPTGAPGVVNIENSVSPTSSSACTQKFVFSAKMYTNGAATVKYRWLYSNNTTGAEQSITYSGASMQTVTMEWTPDTLTPGNTMNGWARVEVLSPGSGLSNHANFTLTCPAATATPTPTP